MNSELLSCPTDVETHLLAGEEDRAGGQAQFEICGRGLPQLIGSRGEIQDVVHQLKEDEHL